ncbi:MAG TPA: NAD(P)H-dependent oxidoreductase subunit E [Ignavibacteria bacterium]|nr:NAD(P)H-dependent oxidoreductase subunit E [Ignavibacteria bacterium]
MNKSSISSARKFEKVCEIMETYSYNKNKLIPILQAVQEEYRYLPEEVLTFIAISLDLSPARVFGVATFYSHFALKPKGKYIIKVCDGTACHVKKSAANIEAICKRLNVTLDKNTTPDMLFTVETVSCLGACGIAPVVVVNDVVHPVMTPEKVVKIIDEIYKKETANELSD